MKTIQNTTDRAHSSLTELQLKLLSFYREYYKKHKRYPRLVEAADYFKTDYRYLAIRAQSLVNKGYMQKLYRGVYAVTRKK